MHYLKCTKCGHFTPVEGEYLMLCRWCNKKLDSNYADWKQRNPDKSFDDYLSSVCISEEVLHQLMKKPKPKRTGLKVFLGLILGFSVMFSIFYFTGNKIVNYLLATQTSSEIFDKEWIKASYGQHGLSIETPKKLEKGTLQLPDNIKQLIVNMDIYNYASEKGFKVSVISSEYNPIIGEGNLQGAADGTIAEIRGKSGITDLHYEESKINNFGISGIQQNGKFKEFNIEFEFTNIIYVKGLVSWQVMTINTTGDEIGRKAVKRVIESIRIERK